MGYSLQKAFRKGVLGAVLLTASFQAGAEMIVPEGASLLPLPETVETVVPDARIEKLKARLRQVPEGEALLIFAAKEGVKISLKDSLQIIPASLKEVEGLSINGLTLGNEISLNQDREDEELLATLVHELRHIRQGAVLLLLGERHTSRQDWILHRFVEADAYAFEIYFLHLLDKAEGKMFAGEKESACADPPLLLCYRQKFEEDLDAGLSYEGAYALLVERLFNFIRARGYEDVIFHALKGAWEEVLKDQERGEKIAHGICLESGVGSITVAIDLFSSIGGGKSDPVFPLRDWTAETIEDEAFSGGPLPSEKVRVLEDLKEKALAPHPKCAVSAPST